MTWPEALTGTLTRSWKADTVRLDERTKERIYWILAGCDLEDHFAVYTFRARHNWQQVYRTSERRERKINNRMWRLQRVELRERRVIEHWVQSRQEYWVNFAIMAYISVHVSAGLLWWGMMLWQATSPRLKRHIVRILATMPRLRRLR